MGLKTSIVNAFTTLTASLFFLVFFTLLNRFHVQHNFGNIPKRCILYYDPTVECNTQEYIIFAAAIAGCVLVIFIISPTGILYTPQDCSGSVSHVVFGDGMVCTCLWNHFWDSTKIEPMVFMTSEWFLHHPSSSGY